jgi:hypothetical protein
MISFFKEKKQPQTGYKAENSRVGITEDDVRVCEDRSRLLDWQIEVQTDVASMEAQMEQFSESTEWLKRTKFAWRMNNRLLEIIKVRLTQLNQSNETAKLFMKVAEDVLHEDMYKMVLNRTMLLIEKQN